MGVFRPITVAIAVVKIGLVAGWRWCYKSPMDEEFAKELEAIAEVGSRRSRTRTSVAVVTWLVCFAIMVSGLFGFRIGFLYAGFLSAPIAAAVAISVVRSLTPKYIAEAAEKHGVPAEKLRQDQFMVD